MKRLPRLLSTLVLASGWAGAAVAQQAAAPTDKQAQAAARAAAVADAEPAVTAPVAPVRAKPTVGSGGKAAPAAPAQKAMDRLDLETTQITGNRELPKVMVVVPWKRSDIGDLAGRPVNSLVDEALQPVDREVFRREIDYYGALAPDHPRTETRITGATPSGQPEK
jgi:hypothetical protein